jgi:hypothetical protein
VAPSDVSDTDVPVFNEHPVVSTKEIIMLDTSNKKGILVFMFISSNDLILSAR